MGNVDNWISAGRPADKFVASVAAYLRRVLRESGMCGGARAMPAERPRGRTLSADRQSGDVTADIQSEVDFVALAACAEREAWGGMFDEKDRPLFNSQGRFYSKLEKAMVLTMQHLPTSQRSTDGRASVSSKSMTERRRELVNTGFFDGIRGWKWASAVGLLFGHQNLIDHQNQIRNTCRPTASTNLQRMR